jgi:hypothetical protein
MNGSRRFLPRFRQTVTGFKCTYSHTVRKQPLPIPSTNKDLQRSLNRCPIHLSGWSSLETGPHVFGARTASSQRGLGSYPVKYTLIGTPQVQQSWDSREIWPRFISHLPSPPRRPG